ncbi:phosphoenolpyruvate--protein phosphotransferase [candidate division GN15 bacterium]|nr:phosphoenolpyruvate--protein phosphotransferase [candidate division GN15 bacterium]
MLKGRKVIKGVGVSSGIVLGHTRVLYPGEKKVPEIAIPPSRIKTEIASLERAVAKTVEELTKLRESAGKRIGGPVAKIFDAQLLIASDYEFLQQVKEQIGEQRRNAGYIYSSLVSQTTVQLRRSPDEYMRQMATDIEAVASRVVSHLSRHRRRKEVKFNPNTILVGKLFTATEVMNYRNLKAVGLLTTEGGRNSHMAMIARSLMMPVVVADFSWSDISSGSRVILDGTNDQAIINPTDSDWSDYQKLRKRQGPALITRIKKLPHVPPLTKDGKEVPVAANLELPGPVEDVLSERKIPIGLYRTEFMYLQSNHFPTEEEQYAYYAQIAERFVDTTVVLRTFDLGSDKFKDDGLVAHEDNPALGLRGIRSMLEMGETFKQQVRAILRASTLGNIRLMLPMVSDVTEVDKAKRLISQVKYDLRKHNIPFDNDIAIGIMIEVPSAALMADQLARRVDFMSLGTNDLTQYTMSADRNNQRVASLYTPYHPAVLHLVKTTVDAGRKHNIPVSVCGEVAGDPLALPLFIGMGVDSLSMNPVKIFDLCRQVKKIDSNLVKHLVGSVMASGSPQAVIRKLQSYRSALDKK